MDRKKTDWLGIASLICAVAGTVMLLMALPSLLNVPMLLLGLAPWVLLVLLISRVRRAQSVVRRCLICGYVGPMETVLYSARGGCFTFILLMAFVVPGVLYMIWRWNTPTCPRCGAVNKAVISDD